MKNYTIKEFEKNFDKLIDVVQNGEKIEIICENGNKFLLLPIEDDITKMYTEFNNEAS